MDSLRGGGGYGGYDAMADSKASTLNTASEEAINGPVVLSCIKCRTIVGDTFAYVTSLPERNYIALQAVPESVVCSKAKKIATERGEEGSMYFELSCGECQAVIGRRYITTVEEIDGIRNAYTLDVGRIITYELGKCLGNKAGNCEAPPPEFYTSVALHEDLVLVKSNVAAIAAKLQKLEQSLARGGGSAVSPRNLPAVAAAAAAAGGSRKRPQQQAQGYNSEIYHVDPSKRNNR